MELETPGQQLCSRCNKPCETSKYKTCDRCRFLNRQLIIAKRKAKCKATDQTSKQCRRYSINDTVYCERHSFILAYTEFEKDNMTQCSGCRHYQFCGEYRLCRSCRSRAKAPSVSDRGVCAGTVIATGEKCTFKADANGYCGNHQLEHWKKQQEFDGRFRVCKGYTRGCKNLLGLNYRYANCDACRITARATDTHRDGRLLIQAQNNVSYSTELLCVICKTSKSAETFVTSVGIFSHKCGGCLDKQRATDSARDRSDRSYAEYDSRPEVVARKKVWVSQNLDKVHTYSKTYREKQKQLLGVSVYNKQQADIAKSWRAAHPEHMQARYDRDKADLNRKLKTYKRSAKKRKKQFLLSDNEAMGFFMDVCYYCNNPPIEGVDLNGIDRKNNSLGYTYDNCVTACKMCNKMKKNAWSDDDFVMVSEHILTVHGFVNGSLHPELFHDHKSHAYYDHFIYQNSCDRDLDVKLSRTDFGQLKSQSCFLCGKANTATHSNGIDRMLNSVCYVRYNCNACCGDCNNMKSDYDLYDIMSRLLLVYTNNNVDYEITPEDYEEVYLQMHRKYGVDPSVNTAPDKVTTVKLKRGYNNSNNNSTAVTRAATARLVMDSATSHPPQSGTTELPQVATTVHHTISSIDSALSAIYSKPKPLSDEDKKMCQNLRKQKSRLHQKNSIPQPATSTPTKIVPVIHPTISSIYSALAAIHSKPKPLSDEDKKTCQNLRKQKSRLSQRIRGVNLSTFVPLTEADRRQRTLDTKKRYRKNLQEKMGIAAFKKMESDRRRVYPLAEDEDIVPSHLYTIPLPF